jgi:aminodeoxychorismate synthase, component I, bacterial clade
MTNYLGDIQSVTPLPYSFSTESWFEALRGCGLPQVFSSGNAQHPAGNVDLICADPILIVRHRAGRTWVEDRLAQEIREDERPPLAVLADCCPIVGETPTAASEVFSGGVAGYFGYELLHRQNRIPREHAPEYDIPAPDMLVGIYDWVIQRDHRKQEARLIVRAASAERQRAILRRVQDILAAGPRTLATAPFRLTAPFRSNFTRDEYLARFQRVIDYIHAGDCYQVNLAQCFTASCEGDGWQAFKQLQQRAQAPFAAYLEEGELQVLSFSPERFLQVHRGQVLTQPIKGTRPRSSDPAQDQANQLDLETSTKDRAENLMIVDLLRNDLGRVCAFGSVAVDKLFETQSFTNVHHLVSSISGRLEKPADVYRLLEASFPGGSITGTPKIRAMEIISELETRPRSVYCGAIGWISRDGNMDSNIAIRTLVRQGDQIHCWGGGGLVADSVGTEEYQETLDKIAIFIGNL